MPAILSIWQPVAVNFILSHQKKKTRSAIQYLVI